ncbi:hypothetical protein TNCV_1269681 [Trichonephila clavipes]|nr:hypothetical protein TNCV_1269681 [Trichonephila clavipes]
MSGHASDAQSIRKRASLISDHGRIVSMEASVTWKNTLAVEYYPAVLCSPPLHPQSWLRNRLYHYHQSSRRMGLTENMSNGKEVVHKHDCQSESKRLETERRFHMRTANPF